MPSVFTLCCFPCSFLWVDSTGYVCEKKYCILSLKSSVINAEPSADYRTDRITICSYNLVEYPTLCSVHLPSKTLVIAVGNKAFIQARLFVQKLLESSAAIVIIYYVYPAFNKKIAGKVNRPPNYLRYARLTFNESKRTCCVILVAFYTFVRIC